MGFDVDAPAVRDFGRIGTDRLTPTARGRFFSSMARSYVTISPAAGGRDRSAIAVMCMNTGSPPPAGVTKPNPRSEFQLVIFPLCRTMFRCRRRLQPEVYWTRSRRRRSNGSSGSQSVVRPNPSAGGQYHSFDRSNSLPGSGRSAISRRRNAATPRHITCSIWPRIREDIAGLGGVGLLIPQRVSRP